MKKLIVALLAVSTVAHAGIYINYSTSYGLLAPDGVSAFTTSGSATLSLIRATGARDVAASPGGTSSGSGPFYYSGSLLSSHDVDSTGTPPPTPTGYDFGGGSGGIAEYGTPSLVDDVVVSTWDAPLTGYADDGGFPEYVYSTGITFDLPGEDGGDFYVVAAIPEPATVGLIALSSTGLMLMRSKKKFKVYHNRMQASSNFELSSDLEDERVSGIL